MVDQSEVRKTVPEADRDKSLANLFYFELPAIAMVVTYIGPSWGKGIGTFIVLLILYVIL